MRDKWKKLQTEVNNWKGHYGRIKARYYTGTGTEELYVKFSNKDYFAETKKQFKYEEVTAYLRDNTDKFGDCSGTGGIQKTNDLEESEIQSKGGVVRINADEYEVSKPRQVWFMLDEDFSTGTQSKVMSTPNAGSNAKVTSNPISRRGYSVISEEKSNNDDGIRHEPNGTDGQKMDMRAVLHRLVTKDAATIE